MESIRNDELFNLFYDVIFVKVKEYFLVFELILLRKRRVLLRYEVGISELYYSSIVRDYYRGLYFEVVDCLIFVIKERFN